MYLDFVTTTLLVDNRQQNECDLNLMYYNRMDIDTLLTYKLFEQTFRSSV